MHEYVALHAASIESTTQLQQKKQKKQLKRKCLKQKKQCSFFMLLKYASPPLAKVNMSCNQLDISQVLSVSRLCPLVISHSPMFPFGLYKFELFTCTHFAC